MKKFSLIITLVLIFNLVSFSQNSQKDIFFKDCSPTQFKMGLDTAHDYILIDLRSVKQYRRSRIKGALFARDASDLFNVVKKTDKNKPIFIYCDEGDESLTASALLMRRGYKKIYNLKEGVDAWYNEGYKLCKDRLYNTSFVNL